MDSQNFRKLEFAQYANILMSTAKSNPEKLTSSEKRLGFSKCKSLNQKLFEMYEEESARNPTIKNVKNASNLLSRLVKQDLLNTVVINLYPGNEGYSMMLQGRNGADTETVRLPYEENELLDYIDAEKLPPLLVDLLDRAQLNLFHSGCVIAEVRDYRRYTNNTYTTSHVLLQPSGHTLLCDINVITSESPTWTSEERLALESQLLLHTSEPLCLDPSPAVFILASKMNHEKHKFNTPSLQRYAKRHSQASINRRRKMSLCAAPKHMKLHDFVLTRKNKLINNTPVNLKIGKPLVDMWMTPDVQLATPDAIDVMKYAKVLDGNDLGRDNSPVTSEEYTFETERGHGKVNLSRLTIMQRLSDNFYIGALYVDRDYKEGESNGSTCRFNLGTRQNVERYIRQFREIFTEEGRRQVKITHQVPGQLPSVTFTQVSQPVKSAQQLPPNIEIANTRPATVGSLPDSSNNLLSQGANAILPSTTVGDPGARMVSPLRLSLSFNSCLASLASHNNSGNPVAHLRLCLPQQQQQQYHQQQLLSRQKSLTTPGTSNTPGLLPSPTALSSAGSGSGLNYKLPVMGSPTGRPPMTFRTEASNLTELLLGDSVGNLNLVHAKQGVWSASNAQSPATAAGAGASNLSLVAPPNVNIVSTNILPPNVNIQNIGGLSGLGLVNLQNSSGSVSTALQQRPFSSGVSTVPVGSASVSAVPICSPSVVLSPSSSETAMSVPIGATGSLTKFMNPSAVKGSGIIRPGAPVLLSTQPAHMVGARNQDAFNMSSPTSVSMISSFRQTSQTNVPAVQSQFRQIVPPSMSSSQIFMGKPGTSPQQSLAKNKAKKGFSQGPP